MWGNSIRQVIPHWQKPPTRLSHVFSQNGAMPIPALHMSVTKEISLTASTSSKPQLPVGDVSTHNSHSSGHTNIAERWSLRAGSVTLHSVHVSLLTLYLNVMVN